MADARSPASPSALGPVVEVSSRRFVVPFQCPCCGAAPDAELAVPLTKSKGRDVSPSSAQQLDFPYCKRCLAHVTSWQGASLVSTGITLAGIVAGIAIALLAHVIAGVLIIVATTVIAYALVTNRRAQAAAMCSHACPGADTAVTYLGWSGNTSAFAFRSPTYTARFAEDNTPKLVNASATLKRLLEGHRVARLAVPTPASTMTVPPPNTTGEWLARIEKAPTRIGRRHDFENAYEMVTEPTERKQLLAAAMRAEIAPVKERLARLRGADRASAVDQAMAQLAADNLPAELQKAVLAELEALGRQV